MKCQRYRSLGCTPAALKLYFNTVDNCMRIDYARTSAKRDASWQTLSGSFHSRIPLV